MSGVKSSPESPLMSFAMGLAAGLAVAGHGRQGRESVGLGHTESVGFESRCQLARNIHSQSIDKQKAGVLFRPAYADCLPCLVGISSNQDLEVARRSIQPRLV